MWVDSHCHLDLLDLSVYGNDLKQFLEVVRADGVDQLLSVGTSEASSLKAFQFAQENPMVFSSVGVHPSDVMEEMLSVERLVELATPEEVVALGETGLDYFHYVDRGVERQKESFRRHIEAAKILKKPLIIHTRQASEDTMDLLRAEKAESGVMHCFTETWEVAKQALDLGFFISISGIVTFKNAEALREVAKKIPQGSLLIETDSPYLAPVPMRGKPNEPRFVKYVGEFLADLRGVSREKLGEATSQNFRRLFQVRR